MDRVDRHRLPELLEILCRQLDVTRRTVLKGASGISVYKQKNNRSESSVVALRKRRLTSCLGWARPWALTMPPTQYTAGLR